MAQNIQLFGPRGGFLTHQWIITWNKWITDKYCDEAKMRTRQKRVVTDTWRSLGCRTTPLEHWSKRKPTVGWLCWGLTSQSTIFQSCQDGAIASWVINQYFRGVKCLAQGHNTATVGLEPRTSRSGVRHSTTEPPRSPKTNSWTPVGQATDKKAPAQTN